MPKCAEERSFTIKTIENQLRLNEVGLLKWEELKGLDGKTARKRIKDYLDTNRLAQLADNDEYEF